MIRSARVVRDLLAEFPGVDARLVVCGENLGANAKVSTLRQLEPHIRHPLVMVSDADVEAPADFAANIAPLLAEPGVGLVNCFYRLANPATTAMRWEAIAINADFWSQVLQARSLGPVDFALGAVMSMPAPCWSKIGGFAPLADYLADDYELGPKRWRGRAGGSNFRTWWSIAGKRPPGGRRFGSINCAGRGRSASAGRCRIL